MDGFLIKPVPADVLAMTVMARARRHRRLAGHITTDGLTGLLNHSQLLSQLDMELVRTRRQQEVLSFVQLNIDHFKDINDTHGHPIGDQVLRTLARILRERLRRSDIVGRLGGDEFGVIMPATEPGQAKVLIGRTGRRVSSGGAQRQHGDVLAGVFGLAWPLPAMAANRAPCWPRRAAAVQQAKAQGGGVVVADSVSPRHKTHPQYNAPPECCSGGALYCGASVRCSYLPAKSVCLRARHMQAHIFIGQNRRQLGWRVVVGEHIVHFADVAQLHHGVAAKLAGVHRQIALAGVFHHRLRARTSR